MKFLLTLQMAILTLFSFSFAEKFLILPLINLKRGDNFDILNLKLAIKQYPTGVKFLKFIQRVVYY